MPEFVETLQSSAEFVRLVLPYIPYLLLGLPALAVVWFAFSAFLIRERTRQQGED